jgi:ligand-binding sensor domain-containing protein
MSLGRRLQVFKPEPIESLSKSEQGTVLSSKPTKIVTLKANEEFQLPQRVVEVFQFAESSDSLLKYLTLKLFKSSDGIMWLTTNDGLYEFNNNRVRFYSEEQGFPPLLSHITEDVAGNLWIGGRTGVIRLDRKGMTTFGTSDGLKSTAIYAIGESKDGSLYVGGFLQSKGFIILPM